MAKPSDKRVPDRTLETIESPLDLSHRALDGWAKMSLLAKQYREATRDERRALQDEFDELSAFMLANAERLREIIFEHHRM